MDHRHLELRLIETCGNPSLNMCGEVPRYCHACSVVYQAKIGKIKFNLGDTN